MASTFTIPLSLAPAAQSLRPAAAWLVPSADAARCLAEVCGWKVDLLQTRLIPLPHSRTDLRTSAVLAIPPPGSVPRITHALPYGWVGAKLLLPTHAILRPALTTAELDALITVPLAVWHPVLGLIECDDAAGLRVWQWLESPPLLQEDWNAAQHGESPLQSLRGIGLRMESLTEDPFGGAGEGIGTGDIKDLPRVPGEPSQSAAAQAMRRVAGGLLRGGANLAEGMAKLGNAVFSPFGLQRPAGSQPPAPGSIRAWMQKQSAAFFDRLERARNAEIHRLMDLLNKDPEMALKFALPLSGLGDMNRGMAPPGTHLGARNTNFQLGALGGGSAVDQWNLADQHRMALTNKYRELANHALAEGRHRRAAYIFAQLLGDITSAAAALQQGRFYAEAAVLYRDRLHNKRMAAKCLTEGGLLLEAVKLLEELGDWVEAGDLHARLENQGDAQRCYTEAVDESLKKKDALRAAMLTEQKLGDAPQALQLLRCAWPDHPQALACLTAEFDFHVRHGHPEAARHRVHELREIERGTYQDAPLCKLLTALSRTYPDGEVRQRTRTFAITVAARVLERGHSGDARGVLHTLGELHPEDRLFRRDAHRFLTPPATKPGKKPETPPLASPRPRGTVSVTGGALIRGERNKLALLTRAFAAAHGVGGLAIAGESPPDPSHPGRHFLQVVCVSLTSPRYNCSGRWEVPPSLFAGPDVPLGMGWMNAGELWLRHPLYEPLRTSNLGITPDSGGRPLRAGTLTSLPLDTVALDCSDAAAVTALRADGVASYHQRDGKLIWTNDLPFNGADLLSNRGLTTRRARVILALGTTLQVIALPHSGTTSQVIDFGRSISSFAANSPYARPMIALGLDTGVALLPLDTPDTLAPVQLNDTLHSPLVIFTAGGTLLAFSQDSALAIQMRGSEPAQVHQFSWDERPIAVTPGPERNQIIVVYRDASWQLVEFRDAKYP